MFQCFDSGLPVGKLDRVPFTFKHRLLDHPALTMEGLAESLPQLSPECITYSKGLSDLSINFDRAHLEHGNGLSLRETIETIRTSNSYIAVRDPVAHPAFRDLYESLRAEMTELQRQSGNSQAIHEPRMWLFIASPNAMTPFHFDRYSNVLMQIRGSKEVAVFPNFRPDIVPWTSARPTWTARKCRHPGTRTWTRMRSSSISGQAIRCTFPTPPATT